MFPLLSLLHPPPPRGEGAAEAASGKRETATAAATTNRETTESFMADLSRNSSWSKLRTWRKRRGGIYTQVCGRPGHKHGEFQGNHGLFGGIGETTYANELTSPICHKNEENYPGFSPPPLAHRHTSTGRQEWECSKYFGKSSVKTAYVKVLSAGAKKLSGEISWRILRYDTG